MTSLREVATHVRSKNAGPFWLTIDIFLPDEKSFHRVENSKLTNTEAIARHFDVSAHHVAIFRIPQLLAIKISIPRPVIQGSRGERDMHGGQQFVPLLDFNI